MSGRLVRFFVDWLNHKIQILLEVVVLLIRLKVVEVKTLFSLAGSLEVGRGPPSKFLKFLFQSNTVRHIFGLDRFFFVASLGCHYRLRLYFGSSSKGLSVFISCSSTLAHVFPHCYFDCDRLHFQFNLIERILNTVIE